MHKLSLKSHVKYSVFTCDSKLNDFSATKPPPTEWWCFRSTEFYDGKGGGRNSDNVTSIISRLSWEFAMTDLGDLSFPFIFYIFASSSSAGLFLSQTFFALDIHARGRAVMATLTCATFQLTRSLNFLPLEHQSLWSEIIQQSSWRITVSDLYSSRYCICCSPSLPIHVWSSWASFSCP